MPLIYTGQNKLLKEADLFPQSDTLIIIYTSLNLTKWTFAMKVILGALHEMFMGLVLANNQSL